MNLKGRPTTISHVYDVMRDISDISRWEIEQFGYTEWSFLKECHEMLASEAGEFETGFLLDRPIVIFGTVPHAQQRGAQVIFLIAAQKFFDLGAPMVRFARRYVSKTIARRPGVRFDAYTASPHRDVDRWLHLLGFEGPIEEGGTRLFRAYGKARDVAPAKC